MAKKSADPATDPPELTVTPAAPPSRVPFHDIPREAPPPEPDWPEPSHAPGDEDRVSRAIHDVKLITDVGSLERVLQAVLSQCKAARVRPEVLQRLTKDSLKSFDAKSGSYDEKS